MARVHNPKRLIGVARTARVWYSGGYAKHTALKLAMAYNYATDPGVLRTEYEHRLCRRFAKACRKRLAAWGLMGHLRETEDGELVSRG
jgi:hypothetical protein